MTATGARPTLQLRCCALVTATRAGVLTSSTYGTGKCIQTTNLCLVAHYYYRELFSGLDTDEELDGSSALAQLLNKEAESEEDDVIEEEEPNGGEDGFSGVTDN